MAKILVVDDDSLTRLMVRRAFEGHYRHELLEASDGEVGLELALREVPDLILCDLFMPVMDGSEMVRRLLDVEGFEHVPVVMLSAVADREAVEQMLELGIKGCIIKPFDIPSLRRKVTMTLAEAESTSQEAIAGLRQRRATALTRAGSPTTFLSRRGLMERLRQEVSAARRHARQIGCLMVEIDDFEQLKNIYRQPFGHQVLRELEGRLVKLVRMEDVCGRYKDGGFVILLPSTPLQGAMVVAERVRMVVAADPFHGDDFEVPVTVSLGVAAYEGEGAVTGTDLLEQAQQRLACARRQGRNCIVAEGASPRP